MMLDEFLKKFASSLPDGSLWAVLVTILAGVVASAVCPCTVPVGLGVAGVVGSSAKNNRRDGFLIALAFFGAPVNWRILWNGRSPPCELPVQHVAERAWSESNPLGEASGGEPVSRNEVNSIRPRDADERRPARLRG